MIRDFGANTHTNKWGVRKSDLRYISAGIVHLHIISTECGYQVLLTKTCNGGTISDILNFIANLSTLKSKHYAF